MSSGLAERIKQVRDFKSLVDYLRTELDWPIESDQIEELAFEWEPDELGLSSEVAVRISSVKQLRPLIGRQPWGIFYIEFESKTLPVVLLRRILKSLTFKKKASADRAERRAWDTSDLLFICAAGEPPSRGMTFGHFEDTGEGKARLKTFSWDESETHFHYLRSLNLEALRWPADATNWAAWRSSWSAAFVTEPRQAIRDSKQLSTKLAGLAQRTREVVSRLLEIEAEDGPLHGLFGSFKTLLIHDLDEDAFADMLAQTIAYGLFSARVTGEGVLGLEHLEAMIPNTNPFLRELFAELASLGGPGTAQIDFDELGVGELVDLLNDMDVEAILQDFGKTSKQGAEDPVIHFYEDFLKEYDSEQRMQRGVFYTPRPVVSFIVRSVDEILRSEFGLEDGLADTSTWGDVVESVEGATIPEGVSPDDPFVRVLDPATGTGTFLVEVIDLVYSRLLERWRAEGRRESQIQGLWNEYVDEHLLPRLCGYELLMAPYAIAHLKIGLKLQETGYRFGTANRVNVYLTNSLELAADRQIILPGFPALAHEAQAVSALKRDQSYTVVLGNPPYSKSSANRSRYAENLVAGYKKLASGERNVQPLSDDYIKFMALAERLILASSVGLSGMITNRGYLVGLIHRGMRFSLLETYNKTLILDCHGDSNIGEQPPAGVANDNLFDIQQGVSIALLVRSPRSTERRFGELWGSRAEKYSALSSGSVMSLTSTVASPPKGPLFFLASMNHSLASEYERHPLLTELFGTGHPTRDQGQRYGNGVKTNRDSLLVGFSAAEVRRRLQLLRDARISDQVVRERLGLEDGPYWNTERERKKVRDDKEDHLVRCLYRPFDWRWLWYQVNLIQIGRGGASPALMRQMQAGPNIALLASRNPQTEDFSSIFCTDAIAEMKAADSTRSSYCFPLYAYQEADEQLFGEGSVPNLVPKVVERMATQIGCEYWPNDDPASAPERTVIRPRDVFGYLYGQLHSPTYRSRYAHFLRTGFPRIFMTDSHELFETLARLGNELSELHLFNAQPKVGQVNYVGSAGVVVEQVRYEPETVWIDKGKRTGFQGVGEHVWQFRVGGYQVCHKWLKDRKGRTFSEEDVAHYRRIISAIDGTIHLMSQVDDAIDAHGGWPNAFSGQLREEGRA